jgi:dihydroflavonol-4-reductase
MIFVTGGTGLIGSHLLYELISAGKRVKALMRETSNLQRVEQVFSCYDENPEDLFHRIEWVKGDILDYFGLEKLLRHAEEVYHCAAVISFRNSDRRQIICNNSEGTANMVNAALENGVKKFCHVSSVAALGYDSSGFFTDENSVWMSPKKVTGYAESKFFSEMEIWRGIEEGLNVVIVNPSIVLGPGFWDTGSSQFFKTVWDGLKFYTRGVTGFVDVKDVVRAMILLMRDDNFETCRNQRYLLSADNYSYQELFNQIADALKKSRPKYYASDFLLGLAWRGASLYSMFTGKSPALTLETSSAANVIHRYDGSKITRTVDFKYQPIGESIKQTAEFLLQEMGERQQRSV